MQERQVLFLKKPPKFGGFLSVPNSTINLNKILALVRWKQGCYQDLFP